MNSSLMLYDASFVAAISRNVGEKTPPRKAIQESYPVYPICSVLVVTAVGQSGDGSFVQNISAID
jgi:hypothetical protein